METNKYYNNLKILSYNAILSFVISNRNYGKTWSFEIRAFRRALKRGKKTLWLRTFKKEVKELSRKMYQSADLQKICGIIPYNQTTKEGNFKQIGNTFYVLRNGKWNWFLQICCLSDSNAMRSADDVDCDTIVYDEFTTTPERMKRYRGNVVTDFIDLWTSARREHSVRCFLLGNKESVLNPFFSYFGIKAPPLNFEGIRTYRKGAIVLQQINNVKVAQNDFDKKVEALLAGTSYGSYLFDSTYKNQINLKQRKTPVEASEYIQLNWNGNEIKISVLNGFFYINSIIDKKRRVYTNSQLGLYTHEALLVKRQKQFFTALINALADNRVYYADYSTFEAVQPFFVWLGV